MISFLQKHKTKIIIATTAGFLLAIFIGLGGYLRSDFRTANAAAKVGKTIVSYDQYQEKVNRTLDNMYANGVDASKITDVIRKLLERRTLEQMILTEIFSQSANDYGIMVTDYEIADAIRNAPAFNRDGKFNREIYNMALARQLRMTPKEFEDEQKKTNAAMRFQSFLLNSAQITPLELKQAYLAQKGNLKGFEKDKDTFKQQLAQEKARAIMDMYVQRYANTHEVRNFVLEREKNIKDI
jgi:peptidyl-prolyl cis-trans isomerase D